MQVTFLFEANRFLLAGYIAAVVLLNFTLYLISVFYRKKLGQNSPRLGFVAGIFFALAYAVTVFISTEKQNAILFVQSFLAIVSGFSSVVGSIGLFLTMRKVRK